MSGQTQELIKNMSNVPSPDPERIREQIVVLRDALLALHKTLVDSERVSYEATVGTISSPNHFLQLLTTDPWFAWLQPFSQLIVAMDEALEARETFSPARAEGLVRRIRSFLVASEDGEGFSRHYFEALQRDPDVVLAQGAVSRLLGLRGGSRPPPDQK